jgi:TetR/AcrR family transcriptional regulator, cholesterol catabolism regulator
MPRSRPYAVRNAPDGPPSRPAPPKPEDLTPNQFARRERIIQVGLTLMLSNDYEDVQVRDVAEAAGVALGTVYRYFASKEHLFSTVFLAWQSTLSHRVITNPPKGDGDRARLTEIAFRAIRAFERQPTFYKLMVMTSRTSDPYAREVSETLTKDSESIFAEPLSSVPVEDRIVIVMIIGAVLEAAIGDWLAGSISIEQVYERMSRVISFLRLPD